MREDENWDRFRLAQAETARPQPSPSSQVSVETSEPSKAKLEEIIVTAQKRTERLQDVPISIAVISSQDIERRGLTGMEDYLRSVPGVNEIEAGAVNNSIIIRGITTSPEFGSATVGHYFDETPITGAAITGGSIDVRPVDIERIEILRGPQGTAFGSASLSGTLRVIPVKPQLDRFGGKLAVSYSDTSGFGSDNSMIQGVVNIPIVEDRFGVRAVGYRYDDSGFYQNIGSNDPALIAIAESFGLGDYVAGYVQDEVGRMLSTGGRLAALWQPTDKLNLSMNFLTQTIEQDGTPVATVGRHEQALMPVDPRDRRRGQVGEVADTELDLLNLVLNYDLGWAALTSVGSWVDSRAVYADSSIPVFGFASQEGVSNGKSFTGEVRLASQLEGRFQFLGGVFYANGDTASDFLEHWPGTPETNLFGTDPQFIFAVTDELEERAVFGEVSYDLTEKLTATVGGRYFEYDKSNSTFFEGGAFGVPFGTGVPLNNESSESNSSFKGHLSYEPTKDSLLYASWSEGFRLGFPTAGLPSAACDTDNDGFLDGTNVSIESTKTVNSDFLENYEIGGKFTLFDRRMVVDTAVYHIEWTGLPARTGAEACGLAYTANLGEATSEGVEFQASLFVVQGLRLDFGGGYSKAKLTQDVPLQGWVEGDRLPGAPKVNANLAAQYDFDVAGHQAFVRADSFYAGRFYRGIGEVPGTQAGDYIKVDMRAGVVINKLSAEIFVRNLTNEDAFTWRTFDAGVNTPFNGYRLRPRTVGIQLGYSFE